MDAATLKPAGITAAAPAWTPVTRTADRVALRSVQIGAAAVMLAATVHKVFELDRFFIPKELALHLTAAFAGMLAFQRMRKTVAGRLDHLLLLYLLASVLSAVFATNHWLAGRALAVSISAVLLFRMGQSLRDAGLARAAVNALTFAIVIVA